MFRSVDIHDMRQLLCSSTLFVASGIVVFKSAALSTNEPMVGKTFAVFCKTLRKRVTFLVITPFTVCLMFHFEQNALGSRMLPYRMSNSSID